MAKGKSNLTEETTDREIVITRVINATRERVWEVWTDPIHVPQWWGPTGFTTTTQVMDVRPGGVWQFIMHGPDGVDYPNKIIYEEIVKPERLVYTHSGDKENDPQQFHVTITFAAQGKKTKLTMRSLFGSAAARDKVVKEYRAIEGGNQTLDRFEAHLAEQSAQGTADRDFVISRVFDAPRDLVFKAFTDPNRMQHWWGPKGYTVLAAKMDLRPGGTYHYGMQAPDGGSMWGKLIYREIVAPKRLVFVNCFSDEAGNITRHPMSPTWPLELLSTITFDEQAKGTLLTIRWALLPSATEEERRTFDAAHNSMQQGWTGTMDQLAAYLAKA